MANNMNRKFGLALTLLSATACTTTPDNYQFGGEAAASSPAVIAGTARLEAVANADVGIPFQYIDEGVSRQLWVSSEYFSANGRWCRRFTEIVNGRDVAGVACNDEGHGWVELPLAAFVR